MPCTTWKRRASDISSEGWPSASSSAGQFWAPTSSPHLRSLRARHSSHNGMNWRGSSSMTGMGSLNGYERAISEDWRPTWLMEKEEREMPYPVSEQLKWLEQAGFSMGDCFWVRAGHAIYGGYRDRCRKRRSPGAWLHPWSSKGVSFCH